ncbi:hypothetical protein [Actinoplanes sp. N902-109]|uniref:hypothetical protein n=1 Tax=Actinoplanes sp. (strain N902-109) TaxID=649831 RepID=UPI0003294E06|nr:hypothetical protein [Actinoplanes sp. N902-109]AGL14597.1 hypothetical protein L083_1087 [Actinoplanes sp. N902-109]
MSSSRPAVAARAGLAAAALLVLAALPGCSNLDEAAAAGVTPNDLVADLAGQLAGSTDLTYEATYQLTGGVTGTIAQVRRPAGTAYVYPDGKLLVTSSATTSCSTGTKPATCTMTAPATPTSPPPATAFHAAGAAGLPAPPVVQTMLNHAVLDPEVDIEQRDTTIAGRHATCVTLRSADGSDDFDTCITNEGVLGSFTGLLGQKRVDVAMTHYAEQISADTFTMPAGARISDRRVQPSVQPSGAQTPSR